MQGFPVLERLPDLRTPLLAMVLATGGCSNIGYGDDDTVSPWADDDDDDDGGGDDDDGDDDLLDTDIGGDTCEEATDLGTLLDDGVGTSLQEDCSVPGDVDWFTFVAADDVSQDLLDGGDQWGVHVRFQQNDDDWFRMLVFRGSCEAEDCAEMGGYDEYDYILDQNPCGYDPYPGCEDDTSPFWVKVFGAQGAAGSRQYTLVIVNG